MNSIEETSQQLNPGSHLLSTIQKINSVQMLLGSFQKNFRTENKSAVISDNATTDVTKINFTGQHTDIAYVSMDNLTVDKIKSCCNDDENLYRNVQEAFRQAESDGYITLDADGTYRLTRNGNDHINSASFIEQFEKDQKNFICNSRYKNTAVVQLRGDDTDINIFRYVDSFNLDQINSADIGKASEIREMVELWQKYGFVDIDNNGNITATEKCKNYLYQQDVNHIKPDISVKKITTNNFDHISDAVQSAQKATNTVADTVTAGVNKGISAVVELSKQGIQMLDTKAQNIGSKV